MASRKSFFHSYRRGSQALGVGAGLALVGLVIAAPGGCTLNLEGIPTGTGGSASTSSITTTDATTTSACASTGGGCSQNSECDDGKPCTDDVCTGGACVSTANDATKPPDGLACTDDVCSGGVESHPLKAAGALCAPGSALVCDGVSTMCPTCTVNSDCGAPTADGCVVPTCTGSTCTMQNATGNANTQAPHDCKVSVCNNGMPTPMVDTTDAPVDDQNPCTLNVCDASGDPYPAAPQGTTCGTGECNNVGQCKGAAGTTCAVAADCASTICLVGLCRAPSGISCSDDLYCATERCNSTICASCNVNGDCKSNVCVSGVCKGAGGAPCNGDTDCAGGKCQYGLCQLDLTAACSSNIDCLSGYCNGGACKACSSNADCSPGSTCGVNVTTSYGVCRLPKDAYCSPAVPVLFLCNSGVCNGFPSTCK